MSDRDLKRGTNQHLRDRRADRLAAWGALWFVFPIACALAVIGVSRIVRSLDAVEHITGLAQIVLTRGELRHLGQCGIDLDDIDPIVNDVVRSQYGVLTEKLDGPASEARARVQVRTVANELSHRTAAQQDRCADILPGFAQGVRTQLWWNLGVVMALLVVVLTSLAGLFIADIYRARREVKASRRLPGQKHPSLEHEIAWERNWRTLERPSPFFARRLGFALLIAAGANYLLAPIGIEASIVGDYTTFHPLIGADSIPHFVDQARNASPVSIGFCGFMIYSLLTLADRAVHRDLDDRLFIALVNRGMVVFILSLVLTGVTDGGPISRALIFLAGVFPKAGIDVIAKLGQLKIEQITSDEVAGFEVLRDINFPKGVTLRELGITDTTDLARADVLGLVLSVGMAPQTLFDAVDQALLIHAFGAAKAKTLESIPLFTATQLLAFVGEGEARRPDRLAIVTEALGAKDLCVQLDELEKNANVVYLQKKRDDYAPRREGPLSAQRG